MAVSWPMRLWLAAPDWFFRVLGAGFFSIFVAFRVSDYSNGFLQAGVWYRFKSGFTLYIPWHGLVDAAYILIALAFCFRLKPLARAARAREILPPIIAAFWPFLPFVVRPVLAACSPQWEDRYRSFMFDSELRVPWRFFTGSTLLVLGNLLQVWGYAVLFRSVSIVAEARRLKTTGPYRIARHPIYLGQFLAQGGLWLFYARTHAVWIAFYLCFVAMQLYRARIEEDVLEDAFGEEYRAWKRKTFWFA